MQVIEGGGAQQGPNVKSYIERQLKSVYDDVLNQAIPDRFLDLLNALDGPAAGSAKNAAAAGAKKEETE
ncbi:MAG: Anti-sigma factor NepR [Hyphomicrobiales bacterium]|nr:Anti-sigma factor NepR [Hyphomicrobiales bacterium]